MQKCKSTGIKDLKMPFSSTVDHAYTSAIDLLWLCQDAIYYA